MAFVIELLLIGVGLSMDAFAVAVCKGLAMRKVNKKAGSCDRIIFRRISGANAIHRMGARNTV